MTINRQNYEEYFMLYADGELDERQRQAVEEFVLENPGLQTELALFSELKLSPDKEDVFREKNVLYRKSETSRSASLIRWWHVAASILILAGIFTLINYSPDRNAGNQLTGRVETVKKDTTAINAIEEEKHPLYRKKGMDSMYASKLTETGKADEQLMPERKKQSAVKVNKYTNETEQPVDNEVSGSNQPESNRALATRNQPESNQVLAASTLISHAESGTEIKVDVGPPEKNYNSILTSAEINSLPPSVEEFPAEQGYIATRKRAIRSFLHKASHIIDKAAELRKTEQLNIRLGNIELAVQ